MCVGLDLVNYLFMFILINYLMIFMVMFIGAFGLS